MAIERIYTLSELAELTGRDASFWAFECSEGRLACLRPDTEEDSILIQASGFESWVSASREGPERAVAIRREVRSEAYLSKAEQDAYRAKISAL